jgi:hypothetical protein
VVAARVAERSAIMQTFGVLLNQRFAAKTRVHGDLHGTVVEYRKNSLYGLRGRACRPIGKRVLKRCRW